MHLSRRLATARTRLTATLTAATVLVGLVGVSTPMPVEAVTTGAACAAGWREMPTPSSAFLSTAFDVVTHEGKEAWIVGGTNSGVLALRWTGGRWKRTAAKTTGHRGLVGAAATGPSKIIGVGYYRPYLGNGAGSLKPISGRVRASGWQGRSVPDLPGPRATLTDVITMPGGKAIAVGTRLQGGRIRATAMTWNGRKWSRSDPFRGTGSGLLGISRSASGSVWAVGWRESGRGRPRPYIVRRTGNGWKARRAASLPAGNAVLTDVHFRGPNNGYAVGYLAQAGSDANHVILMHWDGRSWKNVDLPWSTDFPALPRALSVGSNGTIWIAGTKTANDDREPRGFIANGKGATWRVSSLATPNDIRSEVMAIAATDKGAVAAATVGASLLVLKACGENTTASLSVAGGKKGTTKRKLSVSRIGARRASQKADSKYVHEHHDPSAEVQATGEPSRDAFSIAGDAAATLSLASSPIKHRAFYVRDMAAASGLKQTTKTYDGFAVDFDGNGYKDVFYSRHGTVRPRLALNVGGRFTNADTSAFGSVDRHGCDKGDIDGDGVRDILCAVGASRGKAMKRHELSFQPAGSGRALVMGTAGISDPLGRGRFAAVFKLDGDPYAEVFIANAPDRDDGWPGYSRFYKNVNGSLQPAPGVGLDTSHGAECVETGDFDQDGDMDLAYCTQYGFNGRKAGLRFMRNENGVLKDRTVRLGIKQIGDIDVAFADVTGNGRKDLIQLAPRKLRVSRWTASGYRRIFEIKMSDAWAIAAGDASGDGRADIYIVRGNDKNNKPDRLLVSRNGGKRFASVAIPTTARGSADDVFALDYDKNGLMDFVVLNGRTRAGPVQLLASFPRG
jgi:hypothetical protein